MKFSNLIATWFGSGLAAKAPGTFGSTGTIPLAIILAYFLGFYGIVSVAVLLFFIGVWATKEVTKNSDEKDPSEVVIDETVGVLVTFSFVTPYLNQTMHNWWIYLVGFILFRFFDIVKFGPVKYFDKMKNAWGVMLDDVVAGTLAGLSLYGICHTVFN